MTLQKLADERAELLLALYEAKLQLEYLESRWPTGSTPAVIARVEAALKNALPWAEVVAVLALPPSLARGERGVG
jgi:hypothetical protein